MKDDFFAFVLMPFDDSYDDVYRLGIQGAASEVGITAERLDEQMFTEGMTDRIFRQIETADIIIAEVSEPNPNVFYELGYSHAKEKLCILLTRDADDIPFDLKNRRHIVYGDSLSYLKDELIKAMEWAKEEATELAKGIIRVEFNGPEGRLEASEYYAEGNLKFVFDFFNESNNKPIEISAIYLYSGKKWQILQDGRDCSSTDSDVEPFKHRYYLSSPAVKLDVESWAQLKFAGKKTLASAWKGEEIKDEYNLSGRGMLRFVTSEGKIDYEFRIDVTIDDIPF